MVRYFTKITALTAMICLSVLAAQAQVGYNYDKLDLGVSGIANAVYGDAEKVKYTGSGALHLTYSPVSPFINYVLEFQAGTLAGGDSVNSRSGRQFKNTYVAFVGRVQVQAGEFIDYTDSPLGNVLKNVYLSAGVGAVKNDIKEISRTSNTIAGFYTPGKDKSTEFFIPTRIGYEFKLFNDYNEPSVKIDFGYQVNFMMGENLDGFAAGSRKDVWNQVFLGVKFAIGGNTSYRKPISSY
ncbi:MAG: hypothetical protein ABIN95_05875 [Mucilaginibacter sp.]